MFSYYGSKSKLVRLYPAPKHDLIVEPFAGSARYALKYFDRNVLLIDKFKVVIDVWKYLQAASMKDILSLPSTAGGCYLRNYNITDAERYLIYFCSTGGGAASTGYKVRGGTYNVWDGARTRIANQLFKIRHWQIKMGDYTDAPNAVATWFIDPPYTKGGHKYKSGNKTFDYPGLKSWAESRSGQTIVCENSSAHWMKFNELKKITGVQNTESTEVFWTNEQVEIQTSLFG